MPGGPPLAMVHCLDNATAPVVIGVGCLVLVVLASKFGMRLTECPTLLQSASALIAIHTAIAILVACLEELVSIFITSAIV